MMLRLTLILCIGMYAALMIAGKDRGQLRPGLAEAAARADQPDTGVALASGPTDVAAVDPVTPRPTEDVAVAPAAPTTVASAEPAEPAPYVEPAREVVTAVEEPIFSLSALGNEAVPGAAPVPEVPEGGEGTIWYVNANSVNVRAEPSTEAEVVGRLGSGEATLVVQAVDSEWARIVIQGDGVEGFVAMRYLSPEAP
jgi:uncharacterized protein YgiM (DUF1202 family)